MAGFGSGSSGSCWFRFGSRHHENPKSRILTSPTKLSDVKFVVVSINFEFPVESRVLEGGGRVQAPQGAQTLVQ